MNARARIKQALAAAPARRVVDRVELALPFPPSVNDLWSPNGRGGLRHSPRYRTWITAAGNELLAQRPGRIDGSYCLALTLSRRRPVDLDNSIKAVSDLLEAQGVVANDRLCEHLVVGWDASLAGCRVVVIPFSEARP